jgi:hypothetical protein
VADLELLGKRVRVMLGENNVEEGILLGFGDGGDIEIEGDDGLVWHGWPALEVTPAPRPAAAIPRVRARTTQYEVSLLPESYIDAHCWAVTVEYRGKGKWAILHGRFCLGVDGEWDWEPSPSNREDDWVAAHRFDLQAALDLAREHAPKVTVNGLTPAEVFARHPELTEARDDG